VNQFPYRKAADFVGEFANLSVPLTYSYLECERKASGASNPEAMQILAAAQVRDKATAKAKLDVVLARCTPIQRFVVKHPDGVCTTVRWFYGLLLVAALGALLCGFLANSQQPDTCVDGCGIALE
jgi:hypothetical protein